MASIPSTLDFIAFFLKDSPLESTTEKHQKPRRFLLSLIFEEIQFEYARSWKDGIKDLLVKNLMNMPPKILDAETTPSQLKVKLDSGITVLMPLEYVPTLLLATERERQEMEVFDHSIHSESLDCDLSVEGLVAGAKKVLSLRAKCLTGTRLVFRRERLREANFQA
jgi:hypothetical protein